MNEAKEKPSSANRTPVLQLIGLKKSFGDKSIHKDVNLELYEGEMMGLFGGSGTGKSVLIRSIIGLDRPDAGRVLFEGRDITKLTERQFYEVRQKIGFVFQNGALFDSLTVEENLAYPLKEHTKLKDSEIKERIARMLELIDMKDSNHLLPNELSGGMQKRAGLARATILEPKVILFDEPTAGLDPVNTRRLTGNINRLKERGITGIFVTHDIGAAFEICDRIAILREGVIHVVDTVEAIKRSKDPFVQSFVQGANLT
jgi:phospholipid/cholesterol/gamma-HCH transport system ATP-binding protein